MSIWSEALDPDRWLADHPLPSTELFPEIHYTVQRYYAQLARRVTCSYQLPLTKVGDLLLTD